MLMLENINMKKKRAISNPYNDLLLGQIKKKEKSWKHPYRKFELNIILLPYSECPTKRDCLPTI
jgi:hypothetical protein